MHCSTVKGGLKASERQPQGVIFSFHPGCHPVYLWGAHSHFPPLGWGIHHFPIISAHRVTVLAKAAHSTRLQLPLEPCST